MSLAFLIIIYNGNDIYWHYAKYCETSYRWVDYSIIIVSLVQDRKPLVEEPLHPPGLAAKVEGQVEAMLRRTNSDSDIIKARE